jgi:hypothetical protein
MKAAFPICLTVLAALICSCAYQPHPPPWVVPEAATATDSMRILSARSPAQDTAANIAAGYFGLLGYAEMGGSYFPGLQCQRPRMGRNPGSPPTYIERVFDKLPWHFETRGDLVDRSGKADPWDTYHTRFDAYAETYNRIVVTAPGYPFPSACTIASDQRPLPQ